MVELAMDYPGFSVIKFWRESSQRNRRQLARVSGEAVTQCVEFCPDALDPAIPRKGGIFEPIQEKKWDNTPEGELRHDVTDELTACKRAQLPAPGVLGEFYQNDRPTKNALEKKWVDSMREKLGQPSDLQLRQKTFDRVKWR
jgi:2-oxoglutarate ferredoxin oxidoreductase subunit beta